MCVFACLLVFAVLGFRLKLGKCSSAELDGYTFWLSFQNVLVCEAQITGGSGDGEIFFFFFLSLLCLLTLRLPLEVKYKCALITRICL